MHAAIVYDREPPEEPPVLRLPFSYTGRVVYATITESVANITETQAGHVKIGYTDGDVDTIQDASLIRVGG